MNVSKWKRKMDTYYAEVQPHKLLSDLEVSGFKVRLTNEVKIELSEAYREVSATTEFADTVISKDGSVAVILK